MLKKIKKKSVLSRLYEEKLYEIVAKEIEAGVKRSGIWAKAIAKSRGDQEKAKSLYIEYRVQALKDELELAEFIKEEKNALNKNALNIETDKVFLSKLEKYITSPGRWFHNTHFDEIYDLLEEYITSKEKAILLINDYNKLYNKDLVNELKKLWSSYDRKKMILSKFIEYGIVSEKYPHNYLSREDDKT